MLHALALALGQLGDRRVLTVLGKSLVVTLVLFAVIGWAAWWGGDRLLEWAGVDDRRFDAAEGVRGLLALLGVLVGGLLLWRIVALAVIQLFADEVVVVVEERHYPAAAATARRLGLGEELANAARSAGRALLFNLLALPVALVLLVTGIGAPLVFYLVNAVLLGRELQDMVWLRHRPAPQAAAPLSKSERLLLGGVTTALLTVPIVNLLAPIIGAATAAHLIHRKGGHQAKD